jgi:hypothetical protein
MKKASQPETDRCSLKQPRCMTNIKDIDRSRRLSTRSGKPAEVSTARARTLRLQGKDVNRNPERLNSASRENQEEMNRFSTLICLLLSILFSAVAHCRRVRSFGFFTLTAIAQPGSGNKFRATRAEFLSVSGRFDFLATLIARIVAISPNRIDLSE